MARRIGYRKYAMGLEYLRGVFDERRRHKEEEAKKRQKQAKKLAKLQVKSAKNGAYQPKHLKAEDRDTSAYVPWPLKIYTREDKLPVKDGKLISPVSEESASGPLIEVNIDPAPGLTPDEVELFEEIMQNFISQE